MFLPWIKLKESKSDTDVQAHLSGKTGRAGNINDQVLFKSFEKATIGCACDISTTLR